VRLGVVGAGGAAGLKASISYAASSVGDFKSINTFSDAIDNGINAVGGLNLLAGILAIDMEAANVKKAKALAT
jgi:hypothetical protein